MPQETQPPTLLEEFKGLVREVGEEVSRFAVVQPLLEVQTSITTLSESLRDTTTSTNQARTELVGALTAFRTQLGDHALGDRMTEVQLLLSNLRKMLSTEQVQRETVAGQLASISQLLTDAAQREERVLLLQEQLFSQVQKLESHISREQQGAVSAVNARVDEKSALVLTQIDSAQRGQQARIRDASAGLTTHLSKVRLLLVVNVVLAVVLVGLAALPMVRG